MGLGESPDEGPFVKELPATYLDRTSRITRCTIRLQTELVQPAEVIGRAIEAMRHLAEAKGHQLCVSMVPHLPKLEADPTRLEQIISNLLTNAIKFTQPWGRVEVSVQVEGSTLVLTVRARVPASPPSFYRMSSSCLRRATRRCRGSMVAWAWA